MHFVYIIYNKKLEQYYIGETEYLAMRLDQHNSSYYKNAHTAKANDWELALSLEYDNISQARKAEAFIKKMKSRLFIERLIVDSGWILEKFRVSEGHSPETSGRTL